MNNLNTAKNFLPIVTFRQDLLKDLKSELEMREKGAALQEVFNTIHDKLQKGSLGMVLEFCPEESRNILEVAHLHELSPVLGEMFGELLVQNEAGDRVISVYDRDRYASMAQGARYHQTREGGSIHTDNVNIPTHWDYLILTCLAQAPVGGENILVSALHIHDLLKKNHPDVLTTLTKSFFWEMRGVSDSLYEAPIITYNEKGQPLFRHLRPYMESAHKKASAPLSATQLYALDVLDALTNSTENQQHYRMKKGDLLFTIDSQVLHGRTCFCDAFETISYPELVAGKTGTLKRTMERLWIRQ